MDDGQSSQSVISIPDPLDWLIGPPPAGMATIAPGTSVSSVVGSYATSNLPWWVWAIIGAGGFILIKGLAR